jgi:hypothetical protein
MSDSYEPGADVLIPDEMRERFEREAVERAARKPPKRRITPGKACAAVALGLLAGMFGFMILAILEKVGN